MRVVTTLINILFSTIDLSLDDVSAWDSTFPPDEILRPEVDWEVANIAPGPSEEGMNRKRGNQLQDPYIFEDFDGKLYLFYSGGGEEAIGVAQLVEEKSYRQRHQTSLQ